MPEYSLESQGQPSRLNSPVTEIIFELNTQTKSSPLVISVRIVPLLDSVKCGYIRLKGNI